MSIKLKPDSGGGRFRYSITFDFETAVSIIPVDEDSNNVVPVMAGVMSTSVNGAAENLREVCGVERMSAHSYGIAIDINVKSLKSSRNTDLYGEEGGIIMTLGIEYRPELFANLRIKSILAHGNRKMDSRRPWLGDVRTSWRYFRVLPGC